MKIIAVDQSTKKPLVNSKVQLQIRGKDSGFLSLTTDQAGNLMLDDKYKSQQIAATNGGAQGQWITATDGATLLVALTTGATTKEGAATKDKSKTTGSI